MTRRYVRRAGQIVFGVILMCSAVPVFAQVSAEEAAGGGQIIRKEKEEPPAHLCAGCVAPMFTQGSKGTLTPYGRIELDGI